MPVAPAPAPVATRAPVAAPAASTVRLLTVAVPTMDASSVARRPGPLGPAGERSAAGAHNGAMTEPDAPFYALFGGEAAFRLLVERFYAGVAADDELRPMYPEDDLGPAADRLRMFLEQYWGGPTTYSDQRGHPRLRMRHAPYAITPAARDRWLEHMRAAVDDLDLAPELDERLWGYLEAAAHSMVNTPG